MGERERKSLRKENIWKMENAFPKTRPQIGGDEAPKLKSEGLENLLKWLLTQKGRL